MICQKCKAEGKTSSVYPSPVSSTTLAMNGAYYDESGRYHNHDQNRVEQHFRCSNNHRWKTIHRNSCDCGWKQEIREFLFPEGSDGYIYSKGDGMKTRIVATGEEVPVTFKTLTDEELTQFL